MPQIFVQEMLKQLSVAKPLLVAAATELAERKFFNPAVKQMQKDFDKDKVTQELDAAAQDPVSTPNYSNTLVGLGHKEGKNLFAFIGFTLGETPADDIRPFLDPDHEFGPKMVYVRGSQRDNLTFTFQIYGPNKKEIYNATPLPRFNGGLSWAERIEFGIPGINEFLNKENLKNSESTAGIQVRNRLRSARFSNRSYLSTIFGDFIARFK